MSGRSTWRALSSLPWIDSCTRSSRARRRIGGTAGQAAQSRVAGPGERDSDGAAARPYKNAVGVDLYLDQQSIDTTTPAGKLLFQLTGAFAEFERSMIRQRVRLGLNVIKEKIARDGKFTSKAGKVRRKLGRPGAEPDKIERARRELAKGIGKVAREIGLGVGTVHRLKRQGWHAAN